MFGWFRKKRKKSAFKVGNTLIVNGDKFLIKQVTEHNGHVQAILDGDTGFHSYMYPAKGEGANYFTKLEKAGKLFLPGDAIPIKTIDME